MYPFPKMGSGFVFAVHKPVILSVKISPQSPFDAELPDTQGHAFNPDTLARDLFTALHAKEIE
jgi:hypothetical protein